MAHITFQGVKSFHVFRRNPQKQIQQNTQRRLTVSIQTIRQLEPNQPFTQTNIRWRQILDGGLEMRHQKQNGCFQRLYDDKCDILVHNEDHLLRNIVGLFVNSHSFRGRYGVLDRDGNNTTYSVFLQAQQEFIQQGLQFTIRALFFFLVGKYIILNQRNCWGCQVSFKPFE